jgi:hypothetical protein
MSFKVLGIIYTEFNLEKGPELVYQIPDNYIKQDQFKKISEFVVPTTQFCNKEVTLHLGNAYLLGYPIFLNNSNYERNRFEFNICLLVDEEEYEYNNYLYDCLIKKIDTTFENLEIDFEFDFMKNNLYMIKEFLDELYDQFNKKNSIINIHITEKEEESDINLDDIITESEEDFEDNNIIPLDKLTFEDFSLSKSKTDIPHIRQRQNPPVNYNFIHSSSKEIFKAEFNYIKKSTVKKKINFSFRYIDFAHIKVDIQNYYVPIWIRELDKEEINKLDTINICIINNINGINSVSQIANNVSEGIDLVKYALSSLYIIRGISFVDIFHLSNIYKPTTALKNVKIEGIFEKFQKFCEMNKDEYQFEKYNDDNNANYMDDNKLFSLYVLLANSKNVKNFLDKLKNKDFNINLFIGFGVYLGIVRRIHLYFCPNESNPLTHNNDIFSLMDGKHCEDQICTEKGINLDTLFNIYKEVEDKYYYCYN